MSRFDAHRRWRAFACRIALVAGVMMSLCAAEAFTPEEPGAVVLRSEDESVELGIRAAIFAEAMLVSPEPPVESRLRVRGAVELRTRAFDRIILLIIPYYDGQQLTIFDLFADVVFASQLTLRVGRFKEPVSEERLRSFTTLPFFDRSLVGNLSPARDVGIQAFGSMAAGVVEYAVFLGNGTLDGQNAILNPGGAFDVAARVDFRPGQHLGGGVGASWGPREQSAEPLIHDTAGGTPFVRFPEGARIVGDQVRLGANAWLLYPRVGVRGEVLASSETVELAGTSTRGTNVAWYAEARVVLLGGELTSSGARPSGGDGALDGGWGAWMLLARTTQFRADERFFTRGAVLRPECASRATAAALVLAVHASELNKLLVSYERTWFGGVGGLSGGRETALFGRIQLLW